MEMVLLLGFWLIASFLARTEAARSFAYFQFVQQYPPALCLNNPACPPGVFLPRGFYIHGLWPSNYSAPHDKCIDKATALFDYKLLPNNQVANLAASWPSFTYRSNVDFWAYEYDNHGTCSEALYTEAQYFAHAHWTWTAFDAFSILSTNGIYPGYSYAAADIINAVQRALQGLIPSVMCKTDGAGRMYLHEIIICTDIWLSNVVNCVRPSSCQGIVIYL